MLLSAASPLLFIMKFASSPFLLAILSFVLLCSCEPVPKTDDGGEVVGPSTGVFDPETPTSKGEYFAQLKVNDEIYKLTSAGYFHDVEAKGFSFVFTQSKEDFSSSLKSVPEGTLFFIDVPEVDMNTTSNLPTIIQGDHWTFYFGYAIDGKLAQVNKSYEITSSSIKSGKLFINIKDGVLEIKFEAETNNDDMIEFDYFGKPVKCQDYIIDWFPLSSE